jgi:hypothetical protein
MNGRFEFLSGADAGFALDTNFTNLHQLVERLLTFVTIGVIRVFTRLRLKEATAWQAATFPRRVSKRRSPLGLSPFFLQESIRSD